MNSSSACSDAGTLPPSQRRGGQRPARRGGDEGAGRTSAGRWLGRRLLRRLAFVGLLVSLCAHAYAAAPRAWLDRDRIELGESVTLNIESDGLGSRPDYAPLSADFELRGTSSRPESRFVNGQATTRTLHAVALEPKRTGVIGIPALAVGSARTEPLSLTVLPAAPRSAQAGDAVFLEAELTTDAPYVQQAVVYTLRLYYAVTLLDGQLDAPAPDGAALQRLGDDVSSTRELAGRRYNVVERRYLLLPERSGGLELSPARFRGRALDRNPFGGGRAVSAVGPALALTVRPKPAQAGTPWLPATTLTIEGDVSADAAKTGAPPASQAPAARDVVMGEPLTLTLTLRAEGATAAQLPELRLPASEGLQIFPEAPEIRESVRDGVPQVVLTRRFALIPQRTGELRVSALTLPWWNTRSDRAERVRWPGLALSVAPAPAFAPAADDAPALPAEPAPMRSPATIPERTPIWQGVSALLLLAWLATLIWGWRRGRHARQAREANVDAAASPARLPSLRRALTDGDLHDIASALEAAGAEAMPDRTRPLGLGELAERLLDPAQHEALRLLEAELWGDGDAALARERLRTAFRTGPRFAPPPSPPAAEPLPPLYPRR